MYAYVPLSKIILYFHPRTRLAHDTLTIYSMLCSFTACLPHDVHSKEALLAAGYATSDKGGDNIILLTNVVGGRARAPLFVPAGHLYEGEGKGRGR